MIFIPAVLPCDQHMLIQMIRDPLYAFCPFVAYWQSFEQSLQNESQLEVKISRNRMKAKKSDNVQKFFPCSLIPCLKIVKTVLRHIPLPISYSMLESIIN